MADHRDRIEYWANRVVERAHHLPPADDVLERLNRASTEMWLLVRESGTAELDFHRWGEVMGLVRQRLCGAELYERTAGADE